MTPFEAWYGIKPPVHYFCVFGCVAHVKVAGRHQRKLDDRSTPMVFMGYEPCSKAYRFYNPHTEHVVISRDAVFDEGRAWNWEGDPGVDAAPGEPFVVEVTTTLAPAAAPSTTPRAAALTTTPVQTRSPSGAEPGS